MAEFYSANQKLTNRIPFARSNFLSREDVQPKKLSSRKRVMSFGRTGHLTANVIWPEGTYNRKCRLAKQLIRQKKSFDRTIYLNENAACSQWSLGRKGNSAENFIRLIGSYGLKCHLIVNAVCDCLLTPHCEKYD